MGSRRFQVQDNTGIVKIEFEFELTHLVFEGFYVGVNDRATDSNGRLVGKGDCAIDAWSSYVGIQVSRIWSMEAIAASRLDFLQSHDRNCIGTLR